MNINGAVALVTGGGQGLGLSIATRLHDLGAAVAVADISDKALAQLGPGYSHWRVDVTKPHEVRAAVGEIAAKHGHLDILVNNAGLIYSEPFVNLLNPAGMMHGYDRFRDVLTINLDSVFIVSAMVVEQMITRRTKGAIINISSVSAVGNEGQTAYSAAKSGVNAMTVTWAKELGRWGIRCNAVAPGFIDTDSTRRALDEPALKHITSVTPLRRLGAAEEVAQAVTSLIENDFMTGVVLRVDGGLRI